MTKQDLGKLQTRKMKGLQAKGKKKGGKAKKQKTSEPTEVSQE